MRLSNDRPGTPPYFILRQIHQGRRYRLLAIVTTVTLLIFCGWMLLDVEADGGSGFGFEHYYSTIFTKTTTTPKETYATFGDSLIPAKIWQIFLPKMERHGDHWHEQSWIHPDALHESRTWLALNADSQYTLVGGVGGAAFVKKHFSHRPELVDMYMNLTNVGMKSDFLRYLILGIEGGVYSDTDTQALRAVKYWIPSELQDKVRLVVGIEFDKLDGPNWADIPHDLQFCQWTIAAAPNHPVFARMTDRVMDSLTYLTEVRGGGIPVQDLEIGSFDVMNSTGPAAWTDAVFAQLQEYQPSLNETADLSGLTEPILIGDILILPIDGFGMGQEHSNSTRDGSPPPMALIRHLFTGSWRDSIHED